METHLYRLKSNLQVFQKCKFSSKKPKGFKPSTARRTSPSASSERPSKPRSAACCPTARTSTMKRPPSRTSASRPSLPSKSCTACSVAVGRGRRRSTPLPRRSSTRGRRSSSRPWSTTRSPTPARSRGRGKSRPCTPAASWPLTRTGTTAVRPVSPSCTTSPVRSKLDVGTLKLFDDHLWKICGKFRDFGNKKSWNFCKVPQKKKKKKKKKK